MDVIVAAVMWNWYKRGQNQVYAGVQYKELLFRERKYDIGTQIVCNQSHDTQSRCNNHSKYLKEVKYKITLTSHTVILGLPKWWTLLQLQTVRAFDSSPFWHSLSPRFLLSPYLSLLCQTPEDTPHTPAHYMSSWTPQPANHSSLLLTYLQERVALWFKIDMLPVCMTVIVYRGGKPDHIGYGCTRWDRILLLLYHQPWAQIDAFSKLMN